MANLDRIELLLAIIEEFWTDVPHVAKVIWDWDSAEVEDYLMDTCYTVPILLSRELTEQRPRFTADQERRYQAILALIEKNQPILDKLIKDL